MKTTILLPILVGSLFLIASCNNNKASKISESKPAPTDTSQDTTAIILNSHFVKYSVAKADSANFAFYWKNKLGLKRDPLKYARIRIADMLLSMGIWDQGTVNYIDTTNLGVVLTMGWDKVPQSNKDTVVFHVFLQPVQFNAARDSIKQFLFFNAHRQIVDKNRIPYNHKGGGSHAQIYPQGDLYFTDLNNPCPPLCPGQAEQ